jgi:hypothetical protein
MTKNQKMFSSSRNSAPKMCTSKQCSKNTHNLNIQMYTFQEILGLFNLEDVSTITEEHMKQAKMVVLRTHPDKSRLPANYFIFYKKAYEILYTYYTSQTKVEKVVPNTKITYDPYHVEGSTSITNANDLEQVKQSIETEMKNMKTKKFQEKFNQLYEENMIDKEAKQRAEDRNRWFTQEDALYQVDSKGSTKDNIGQKMGGIRREMALDKYRGVQTLSSFGGGIATGNLWDDVENSDSVDDSYITTDPFSRLKFDDLRRVHKDETVFVIDESHYDKIPKYDTVDKYNRARDSMDLTPINEPESRRLLQEQEERLKSQQAKYQQEAILKSRAFEEKNKNVMAQFLRIGY